VSSVPIGETFQHQEWCSHATAICEKVSLIRRTRSWLFAAFLSSRRCTESGNPARGNHQRELDCDRNSERSLPFRFTRAGTASRVPEKAYEVKRAATRRGMPDTLPSEWGSISKLSNWRSAASSCYAAARPISAPRYAAGGLLSWRSAVIDRKAGRKYPSAAPLEWRGTLQGRPPGAPEHHSLYTTPVSRVPPIGAVSIDIFHSRPARHALLQFSEQLARAVPKSDASGLPSSSRLDRTSQLRYPYIGPSIPGAEYASEVCPRGGAI